MVQASPAKTDVQPVQLACFSWTSWLTAICGTLLIFVILTWLILTAETVHVFDWSCAGALQEHAYNNPAMRHFLWLVTWVGGIVGLTLLATAGTVTMCLRRQYLLAGIWVLATAGGALVNLSVKETVARVRPIPEMRDLAVADIRNPSYPSGHAMGSAIGMGMWFFAVLHFMKNKRGRRSIAAGLILLILLIGFSRIYLRAHWFTDVLGGFALGASWLLLCLAIHGRYQNRFALPRKVE